MAEHTPGPWEVGFVDGDIEKPKLLFEIRAKDFSAPLVGDCRGFVIGYVASDYYLKENPVTGANARLVAAAPELLEACKNVTRLLEGWIKRANLPIHGIDDALIKHAKNTIAKAEDI